MAHSRVSKLVTLEGIATTFPNRIRIPADSLINQARCCEADSIRLSGIHDKMEQHILGLRMRSLYCRHWRPGPLSLV
jgi:hypothetical protein